MSLIAAGANLRSRWFALPYGDQAIFLPARTFHNLGGYPLLPIMEDFALVRQLAKQGRIITLAERVTTSARRWQRLGLVRTTLINQAVVAGFLLGISPATLARWYRRQKK